MDSRQERLAKMEKALHAASTALTEIIEGESVTFHDPEFAEDVIFAKKLIDEAFKQQNQLN